MSTIRQLSLVAAGTIGLLTAGASAATISFQNGASNAYVSNYAGTSDTSFNSANDSGGGYNNGNNGGANYIYATQTVTWEERRALIGFDLSSLTGQGITVNSATMKLATIYNTSPDNVIVTFYPVAAANAGWVQGTNGSVVSPANAGEATWNHKAHPGTNWAGSPGLSTPGTDYINTAAATGVYNPATADGTYVSFALTPSVVQSWIDTPSDNGGLLLLTDNDSTNGYYRFAEYYSSEADAGLRPILELNVTAVPEPASLAGLGLLGVLLRRRRA